MREFLDALWPDLASLYGELRFIKNGTVEQRWTQTTEVGVAVRGWDSQGWDAYCGILPRRRRGGTAEDCVDTTRVLWADVDAKSHASKTDALYAITEYSIPASTIVDSGGGFHAYWYLDQAVPFSTAQRAMRHVAGLIGGDTVSDAPRILRIPGTQNHKYDPPEPVRLLRLDTTYRHDIEAFTWDLPENRRRSAAAFPRERLPLPPWLVDLIERSAPKGSRSERDFRVARELLEAGVLPAEIRAIFREHPDGCGSKVAEMKPREAERYLERTIAKAISGP